MISVIVPVYKVEEYLSRCIDSILKQTYKNLEIILVDDGSPDNCGKICDEYALKDERIKVIHKQNGGLSSARNSGLDAATGEYVTFVDSDDWIDVAYVQTLKDVLENTASDMSACIFCRTKGAEAERKFFNNIPEIITCEKYFSVLSENSYAGYACNKLFKKDIIEKNGIRFDEKIFNGEDFPFVLEYLRFAEKTAFVKQDLYFYFFRGTSIMNSIRLNERFMTILYAREKALSFLQCYAPDCYDVCKASYLSILSKIKFMAMVDKNKYCEIYREVQEKLRLNKKGLWKLKRVGLKTKLKLFFMIYFPSIMARIYQKKIRVVE